MRSRYVDVSRQRHINIFLLELINTWVKQEVTMSRELLHEVRDTLRAADAIASEREFCERWLGENECYMRTLRLNTVESNADALATVSNKLKYYAKQMNAKDVQHLRDLGVEFERLAEACWTSIQTTARRKWAAVA